MLFQLVSKSSKALILLYLRAFLDFVCGSAFRYLFYNLNAVSIVHSKVC
nr:MAG TPA: hypothetical protein [Caudoviricetes sp.]